MAGEGGTRLAEESAWFFAAIESAADDARGDSPVARRLLREQSHAQNLSFLQWLANRSPVERRIVRLRPAAADHRDRTRQPRRPPRLQVVAHQPRRPLHPRFVPKFTRPPNSAAGPPPRGSTPSPARSPSGAPSASSTPRCPYAPTADARPSRRPRTSSAPSPAEPRPAPSPSATAPGPRSASRRRSVRTAARSPPRSPNGSSPPTAPALAGPPPAPPPEARRPDAPPTPPTTPSAPSPAPPLAPTSTPPAPPAVPTPPLPSPSCLPRLDHRQSSLPSRASSLASGKNQGYGDPRWHSNSMPPRSGHLPKICRTPASTREHPCLARSALAPARPRATHCPKRYDNLTSCTRCPYLRKSLTLKVASRRSPWASMVATMLAS